MVVDGWEDGDAGSEEVKDWVFDMISARLSSSNGPSMTHAKEAVLNLHVFEFRASGHNM
jgi:hypothetical protein